MKSTFVTAASVAFLLWVATAPAAAQERKGFWFGVSAGYGSAALNFDETAGAENSREGSGVANVRAGWTLGKRLLLGGEFNLWTKTEALEPGIEATVNIYNAVVTVTAYPRSTGGFFVKAGAGAAFLDTDFDMEGTNLTVSMGKGFAAILGAGYDIPVSRRISVTPAVNWWYGRTGDVKVPGETLLTNGRYNVIDVSVGITFP